jgi:hypothetical protein
MNRYRSLVECYRRAEVRGGGTVVLGVKPVKMPLSQSQIPCGLAWDGTRFSTLRTKTWIRCACVRTCVDFTVVTNFSEERFTFLVRVDLTMAARGYTALCARRSKSQDMITLGTCSCCRVKECYTFTALHVSKRLQLG